MPKEYCCNKLLESGTVCGERDSTKFSSGRYTTCRNCRLRFMTSYNKKKTSDKKEEKNTNIDPECNIRYLIEDTIKRIPLMNNYTIPERIESFEEEYTEFLSKHERRNGTIQSKFNLLEQKIESLEKYIEKIEKELSELKKDKNL
jgi:lipopolysaccharide assembly outer membrane protein LptD (OstA)